MKLFILTLFLASIIAAAVSNPAKDVHGITQHGRERSGERSVDVNAARRAISLGNASKVRSETRNGTVRDIYEGSYQDSHGTTRFRLVMAAADGHVITVIRLNDPPRRTTTQRPPQSTTRARSLKRDKSPRRNEPPKRSGSPSRKDKKKGGKK
jgi:hypothetical protein